MLQTLRIFLSWPGKAKWFVAAGLLFASLAEGLGLASLIPALSVALESSSQTTGLSGKMIGLLASLGLSPRLELLFGLFIGFMICKAVLFIAIYSYVARTVADLSVELRAKLIDRLSRARWSLFTEHPLGGFSNVVTTDVQRSCKAVEMSAVFVATLFQTFIFIFVALMISWQVALGGSLFGLIIVGLLSPFLKKSRKQGKHQQIRMMELTISLSDLLQNLKPVKAMEQQTSFINYFVKQARAYARAFRKQRVYEISMKALREPLASICIVLGFYVAHLSLTLSIADWVVMALVMSRLISRMAVVQEKLQNTVALYASYQKVQDMTAAIEAEAEQAVGAAAPRVEEAITFHDVTFAHGSHQIFRRLNLYLPMKGVTVIMGESGSGKSTLIDLLVGFYRPQSGTVSLDGTPLDKIDLHGLRKQVGYVPQEVVLFNDSLWTNLTLGDDSIPESIVVQALKDAGAWEFVQALPDGLASPMGEKGSFLSGGQRQRIGLARALVRQPMLLILDEVTSALDKSSEGIMRAQIRRLAQRTPVLVITHTDRWLNEADRAYRLSPLVPGEDSHPEKLSLKSGEGPKISEALRGMA